MSARIPWQIYDPITLTTIYLEINPNSGASPEYKKNFTKKATTAPGTEGQTLIFQGATDPQQFPFSGVILTEAQYNVLYNAWLKNYPLQITDDLGRVFVVQLETFLPKRKISRNYPWRHDFSVDGVVLR